MTVLRIPEKLAEARRLLVLDSLREGVMDDLVALAQKMLPKAEVLTRKDAVAAGIPEFMADTIGADWIEVYPPCSDKVSTAFNMAAKRIIRDALREQRPIVAIVEEPVWFGHNLPDTQ